MNAQECQEIYEDLKKILQDYTLQWVVQQVDETIRKGKTVEEYLPEKGSSEISRRTNPSQSRSRPNRIKIKDYTPQEKLLILIDAVEEAIDTSGDVEMAISNFFSQQEESDLIPEITFYAEFTEYEDEKQERHFTFPEQEIRQRREVVKELKELLNNLRKEVKN